MKGKMIIAAITAGMLMRAYCSNGDKITKSAFETNLLTLITIGFVILIFYVATEIRNLMEDIKNDKISDNARKNIKYHNCKEERAIAEFKKERKEFFDHYFNDPLITMKVMK